jgi:hypothetical protein
MKYFTKDLWLAWNNQGSIDPKKAIEIGNEAFDNYRHELERLKPRLGAQTYEFFTRESLHDGRVLSLIVGDGINHEVGGVKPFDINARQTAVRIQVFGSEMDVLYTLSYEGIRRVVFDFPSDEPLFYHEGDNIGDWGYDEISAPDAKYLRHEVLFSSGTSVVIEFKKFSYSKEACKGSRYLDRI